MFLQKLLTKQVRCHCCEPDEAEVYTVSIFFNLFGRQKAWWWSRRYRIMKFVREEEIDRFWYKRSFWEVVGFRKGENRAVCRVLADKYGEDWHITGQAYVR